MAKKMNIETVVTAFSEDQVARLTGVSKTQLRYWDRTSFFIPALVNENRRLAYSRIYSFKDIVSLRVLHVLRNQYSVPLQHLRVVSDALKELKDDKWTATELFVLNKLVIFAEPKTKKYREIVSGQYVIGIPLRTVVEETKRDIEELHQRDNKTIGKITRGRFVNHNTFVIAGTRIPVRAIQDFSNEGFSIKDILKEYPTLKREDVEAALAYKAEKSAA